MWIVEPKRLPQREHPLDRHVRLAAGLDLQNHARTPVRPVRWWWAGCGALVLVLGVLVLISLGLY